MTKNEIRSLLKEYKGLIAYQEHAHTKLAELNQKKFSVMSNSERTLDKMPHTSGFADTVGIKVTTAITKYDEDIRYFQLSLEQNRQKIKYIHNLLSMIPYKGSLILRTRYCLGKSWEDVSDKAHYSLSWTKKLAERYIGILVQKTQG